MGTSIDKFKFNFDQGARSNRFSVDIHCPKLGFSLEGIRVESCSLPGRQLTTNPWSEYGVRRNMVTGEILEDGGTIELTFLCDSSFEDRFLIESWNSIIYENAGLQEGTTTHPIFAYLDDYSGTVNIAQLRHNDKEALTYTLNEAYPSAFAPQEMSQGESGIMKFSCTISFRNWTSEYKAAPKLSALNKGRRALRGFADALGTLGRYNKTAQKFADRLTRSDSRLGRLANLFGGNG
jgi:hypothetical protein